MELALQDLNAAAFAPFGDVIETAGAKTLEINDGHCTRFHDLAKIDVTDDGGRPLVNIFRTRLWPMPCRSK